MTISRRDLLYGVSGAFASVFSLTVPSAGQEEGVRGDVPYVPTPPEVVEAMLKLGGVNKNDILYDLGCGDGRIVVMAAQKFGAHGTGVDINPERIKEANENARHAGEPIGCDSSRRT